MAKIVAKVYDYVCGTIELLYELLWSMFEDELNEKLKIKNLQDENKRITKQNSINA